MITIEEQKGGTCKRITVTDKKTTTFEIYQAEDFTDNISAKGCFRVKKDRSWYPDKKTYWSYNDVCYMLMDAHGFKPTEIDHKEMLTDVHFATPNDEMWHPQVYGNGKSESVDLDAKYQDKIKSVSQRRYSGAEIDRFFAKKYGTDIYGKNAERAMFDQLPAAEQQKWLDEQIGETPDDDSVIALVRDYYQQLQPNDPAWVITQVDWFKRLKPKEKAETLKGITGKTLKSTKINSGDGDWKNKPWNEVKNDLKQKMEDDKKRIKGENVNDLPNEWMG